MVADGAVRGQGYAARLTSGPVVGGGVGEIPKESLQALASGDVVSIDSDGTVRQLWDADSRDNVILVTNDCNCRCVMCPQRLGADPPGLLAFNARLLRLAANKGAASVALTGGEPTLRVDDMCTLVRLTKRYLPNASLAILTNGRAYRDLSVVQRIAAMRHPDLIHCVALHADAASLHDEIAGRRGCHDDVVLGLHNLAREWQRVEVRVTVSRLNAARLPQIAAFIYRNFPFVCHVAFMGLEVFASAATNVERVWIEPKAYADALMRAVRELKRRELEVSIYNIPLCLLPRELHSYSRDSISDWKKRYLPTCSSCSVMTLCGGLFGTSSQQSQDIQPCTA